MTNSLSCLIVHPNLFFRKGLEALLRDVSGNSEIIDVDGLDAAERILAKDQCDIIIADRELLSPLDDALLAILERCGDSARLALVVSDWEPAFAPYLTHERFAGFLMPDAEQAQMPHALRYILAGGVYVPVKLISATVGANGYDDGAEPPLLPGLTRQQERVLAYLHRGMSNKEIARNMGLSDAAIKAHVSALMRIMSVRNRTELVTRTLRH